MIKCQSWYVSLGYTRQVYKLLLGVLHLAFKLAVYSSKYSIAAVEIKFYSLGDFTRHPTDFE